jgi:pimeloyl-ACP methyl ester carboxylesterase
VTGRRKPGAPAAEAYVREIYARNPATLPAHNHAGPGPALRSIRTPTLVVHGEADPLVPLAGADQTASAIPGARRVVLPDAGIYSFIPARG